MSLTVRKIIDDRRSYLLPVLKRYAGAVDDSQDAVLQQMLTAAIMEVQSHADASIVPCELELRISNNGGRDVRLYQTPAEVVSVTDGGGSPVQYVQEGRALRTAGVHESLTVVYTTRPDEAESARLMPVVYQYATALYDGQTDELVKILSQC